MSKRVLDLAASGLGLLVLSPVFAVASLLIWLEDRRSPLYIAPRIGGGGRRFRNLSTPVRHSWELIREQSPVS